MTAQRQDDRGHPSNNKHVGEPTHREERKRRGLKKGRKRQVYRDDEVREDGCSPGRPREGRLTCRPALRVSALTAEGAMHVHGDTVRGKKCTNNWVLLGQFSRLWHPYDTILIGRSQRRRQVAHCVNCGCMTIPADVTRRDCHHAPLPTGHGTMPTPARHPHR